MTEHKTETQGSLAELVWFTLPRPICMAQHSISCSGYVSQTDIMREKQFCHKTQAGDYCDCNLLLTATTEVSGNSCSTANGSAPASTTAGMIAAIAIIIVIIIVLLLYFRIITCTTKVYKSHCQFNYYLLYLNRRKFS